MPALPTFFLIGAPKAGTTSLYHYLDQHPQIYMSPIKEPSYFASELRPENFHPRIKLQMRREMEDVRRYLRGAMTEKRFGGPVADWEDYLKLFENAREAVRGEASASYLWSEA
ncbi:MAG TPA: sulfotransferase, partial [Bryobacteraceae bacterium]|nr:sulfotransferase [Bryobacteraceae bacterium]